MALKKAQLMAKEVKDLYMCMIDWQHELGEAAGGTLVYASLNDLKKHHTCWEECGVVKVKVVLEEDNVVPQNLFGKLDD